jgi:hypothetical protein
MSRVNEHYNGYIVDSKGLDDLRDQVLKVGTTNFVTDALVGEKNLCHNAHNSE